MGSEEDDADGLHKVIVEALGGAIEEQFQQIGGDETLVDADLATATRAAYLFLFGVVVVAASLVYRCCCRARRRPRTAKAD